MARRLVSLLLTAVAAACGFGGGSPPPQPTEIRIDDSGALTVGARASIGFARRSGAPSEPQRGHAIELGVSRAGGEDSQALSAGQPPVRHGDQSFAAPQQLAYDAELAYSEVAYRFRNFSDNVGFEVLAGFAQARLDLTASSPSQRASEKASSAGPSLGLGVLWRLRPATTLHARATFFESGGEIEQARRFELGVVQALGANFGLRAGYLLWDVDADRGRQLSAIRAKFSGPALGLEVMF